MERVCRQAVLWAVCVLLLACGSNASHLDTGLLRPTLVAHLYPQGQGVDQGIVEDGVTVTLGPGEASVPDTTEFYWDRDGSVNAVSDSARVEVYLPEHRNGQMILVCPGGGYGELMYRSEGTYAARILTAKGYAVAILCYRMPRGHAAIPLTDVQNAFRYLRYHAAGWGISQIGIMGMSAGGHLAACASTMYVDSQTRPDFTILFYAVTTCEEGLVHRGSLHALTGLPASEISAASVLLSTPQSPDRREGPSTYAEAYLNLVRDELERWSPVHHVTADTPPALLFHSEDDRGVKPAHSFRYFEALRSAGVRAELHIFPQGGHGWGFSTDETIGTPTYGTIPFPVPADAGPVDVPGDGSAAPQPKRSDKLGPYRAVFYDALYTFLEHVRPE